MIFDELQAKREKPIRLIFGTDWWTDCDDVLALEILLRAHRRGLISLEAIGVNSVMPYSAPSVRAVCEQHGLGSIPVGLDAGAVRKGVFCMYQKKLASFCASGATNADCPDAYKLYRKTLAAAEEKTVIVDVGFPQLLMEVLGSSPDEYSPLDGTALIKSKASEIILMGGRWDKKRGLEYNFCAHRINRAAANYVCRQSPVPLTFLGYEVGKDVLTGGKHAPGLTGIAYARHGSGRGRPSWDPMTAVYAVTGDAGAAGYDKIYGTAEVDPKTGKNSFTANAFGTHAYLVKTRDDSFYRNQINEILNDGKEA